MIDTGMETDIDNRFCTIEGCSIVVGNWLWYKINNYVWVLGWILPFFSCNHTFSNAICLQHLSHQDSVIGCIQKKVWLKFHNIKFTLVIHMQTSPSSMHLIPFHMIWCNLMDLITEHDCGGKAIRNYS